MASNSDKAAARLKRDLGPVAKRLVRVLAELMEDVGNVTQAEALAEAAELENQILEAMEEAGIDDVLDDAEEEIARAAIEAAEGLGVNTFSPSAQAAIEAVANQHMDQVADLFGEAATDIRRIVVGAMVTGEDVEAMLGEVSEALDTTIGRAQSAVFTATQAVGRASQVATAEEILDDPVYLYTGPAGPGSLPKARQNFGADSKTRPFCEKYVGRAYTLAALSVLDNGQGLPVPSTLGGYNCRHLLTPMSRTEATEEGWEVVG